MVTLRTIEVIQAKVYLSVGGVNPINKTEMPCLLCQYCGSEGQVHAHQCQCIQCIRLQNIVLSMSAQCSTANVRSKELSFGLPFPWSS